MTGTIDPDILEPPARPRPAPRPRRRRTRLIRRGWRLWVVLAVTTALSIIALALGVVAWDTIENSKLGRTIEREGSTADFELPETPAQFLVAAGNQDVFLGAVVMAVSTRGAGGWAFLVPPTAEVPDVSGGTAPIGEIYARDGVEGVDVSLERLFGADLDQGTVIGPSDWQSFLGGPVEVSFPFHVEAPDENGTLSELYPAGTATVQPDDVPYLLQLLLDGEAESNRLERHLAFWQGAVASMQSRSEGAPSTTTTSTAVVPGAVTTVAPPEPFASFVTRLVAGEVVVKRIPGRLNGTWPDGEERYDPEEIELGVDVAQAMPGAVSPLELAPRVWLVNTTGRRDVLLEAAGLLFVLGFNLVMASDDPDGPVETTELHWWGPDEQRAVAEHVREGLEFGVIVEDGDVIEGLDMAIHLGRDWSERIDELAASRTTTTTLARTTTTTVRSSGSGGTTPRPSPATTSGTTVAPTSTVESSSSTTEGEEPSASTTPDATATTVPSTSGTATSVSPTTSTVDAPTTST